MIKAVIFDYNGTLYKDDEINYISWKEIINKITKNRIDFDKFYSNFPAVNDHYIIESATKQANISFTAEEIEYWTQTKEKLYRDMVLASDNHNMTSGGEQLLDFLVANNIKINLCSASIIENINFYFDFLNLNRWFDRKLVSYDDHKHINKKDMYEDAAKNIGVELKDCLIIEDSPHSIELAREAGCKKFIAIKRSDTVIIPEIKQIIDDFTQIDYSLFE